MSFTEETKGVLTPNVRIDFPAVATPRYIFRHYIQLFHTIRDDVCLEFTFDSTSNFDFALEDISSLKDALLDGGYSGVSIPVTGLIREPAGYPPYMPYAIYADEYNFIVMIYQMSDGIPQNVIPSISLTNEKYSCIDHIIQLIT